ncbi:signal peptidase I [Fusobacterium sp.]|uniref:signal peptidase I n=1 Tax=Fusobacterium sp. TaxID=68766 RepID=UPI0028FFBEF5|nr:signal peptidase I [Fusobacterium sp.]MDU1910642.1 signal peptidase I [Fusobacterium sp.]
MEKSKVILNSIFYVILTAIFVYIFVKEKALTDTIKIYRDKFADKVIMVLNIKGKVLSKGIRTTINLVETIGTALILVLIIQKFYLGNFLVPTGSMIPTIMPKDRLFGNMLIYKFRKPQREEIIVFREPIQNKVLYTKRVMGLPGETVNIKNNHLYVNDKEITTREYTNIGEIGNEKWIVPKKGDTIEIIPGKDYGKLFRENMINVGEVQKYLVDNPGAVGEILPDLEFRVNGEKTGMLLDLIHESKYVNRILKGENVALISEKDYYLALGDNTNGSYDSRMWGFVSEDRIKGEAFIRFWPLNRIKLLK